MASMSAEEEEPLEKQSVVSQAEGEAEKCEVAEQPKKKGWAIDKTPSTTQEGKPGEPTNGSDRGMILISLHCQSRNGLLWADLVAVDRGGFGKERRDNDGSIMSESVHLLLTPSSTSTKYEDAWGRSPLLMSCTNSRRWACGRRVKPDEHN